MIRRLAIAVLGAIALAAPIAIGAVPASAATNFYLRSFNGTGYYLDDAGHAQLAEVAGAFTIYHWADESNGFGELVDQSGLCLEIGSNTYAYFESCNNSTPERFMDNGGYIGNQHTAQFLATTGGSGGLVFETTVKNTASQWTNPGA